MLNFNAFTTRHDLNNALALARAAELAYKEEENIRAKTEEWGATHFMFVSAEETQAFVTSDDDVVIVAFRGTEQKIEDIITDARFGLVDGPLEGKVHRGFREALRAVSDEVQEAVSDFQRNGRSLWVTGHSLGGALATLATAGWIDEDKPINGLYTFGSPRVGDKRFSRHFGAEAKHKTFRYANNRDIVTRVPPRLLDYRHVGTLKYFDANGRLHDDPGVWNQVLDRVTGALDNFEELLKETVGDHAIAEYIRLTEAALQSPERTESHDVVEAAVAKVLDIRKLFQS